MTTAETTLSDAVPPEAADLKPKRPTNRAPEGIRTFTVCRQNDETGVSGEGVILQIIQLLRLKTENKLFMVWMGVYKKMKLPASPKKTKKQ